MQNATLNLLLHDLFLLAVTGASIFVKNPVTQQHAQTLTQLASALLDQIAPTPPAPPAA